MFERKWGGGCAYIGSKRGVDQCFIPHEVSGGIADIQRKTEMHEEHFNFKIVLLHTAESITRTEDGLLLGCIN